MGKNKMDVKLLKEHLSRIQKRIISEKFDRADGVKRLKGLLKITNDKKMLSAMRELQVKIQSESDASTMKKAKALKALTELGEAILSGDDKDAEVLLRDVDRQLKSL